MEKRAVRELAQSLQSLACFPLTQQNEKTYIVRPLRSCVQVHKVTGPIVLSDQIEGTRTGTKLVVARIEPHGRVALFLSLFAQTCIAQDIGKSEVGETTLRPFLHHGLGFLIGLRQLAGICVQTDNLLRCIFQVRVEGEGTTQSRHRAQHRSCRPDSVFLLVVVTLSEGGPSWGESWIQSY